MLAEFDMGSVTAVRLAAVTWDQGLPGGRRQFSLVVIRLTRGRPLAIAPTSGTPRFTLDCRLAGKLCSLRQCERAALSDT